MTVIEMHIVLKWLDERIANLERYEQSVHERGGYHLFAMRLYRENLHVELQALQQRAGGGGE